MGDKSRLETLLEKQKNLEGQIAEEKAKEEANKVLNSLGADVATVVQTAAVKAKVDIKVLHGKFFALTVGDDGKLTVEVVSKARRTGNSGSGASGNGNGNGNFEYHLKDGRGPFESIQKAMDALGVPSANRPQHNRYDRLSAEWQGKIERREKAQATPPKPEPKPEPEPAPKS